MNAVYTVLQKAEIQMSQSYKLTQRFSLADITGQAVPENCSALTEAVMFFMKLVRGNGSISLLIESLSE